MKKQKVINCKDNLDRRQEIMARRIKDKLLNEKESEEYFEKLRMLYNQLISQNNGKTNLDEYAKYVSENDAILYSACLRAKVDLSVFMI